MNKKNVIYITKRALLNLPDDVPIYVLVNPDSPEPSNLNNLCKNNTNDVLQVDNDKQQSPIETAPLEDCETSAVTYDIDDEFITTVDIETSDIKNEETPDRLTEFYDSLYSITDDICFFDKKDASTDENRIDDEEDEACVEYKDSGCLDNLTDDVSFFEKEIDTIDNSDIQTNSIKFKNEMDLVNNSITDKNETVEEDMTKDLILKPPELNSLVLPNDSNEPLSKMVEFNDVLVEPVEKDNMNNICDKYEFAIESLESENPDMVQQKNNEKAVSLPLTLPNNNFTQHPVIPIEHNNFSFTSVPPPGFYLPQFDHMNIYNSVPPMKPQVPLEDITKKAEEIMKIKERRRLDALKEPLRPVEFKKISQIHMNLNEKYLIYLRKGKKTVTGTKAMKDLEDEFEEKVLNRRVKALENQVVWKPLDRSQFIDNDLQNEAILSSDEEVEDTNDDSILSDNNSLSEDEEESNNFVNKKEEEVIASSAVATETGFTEHQLKQLARIEKKVAETRRRLNLQHKVDHNTKTKPNENNDNGTGGANQRCNYACRRRTNKRNSNAGVNSASKKPKQSVDYRTIQENRLHNNAPVISAGRTLQQQAEINHKLAHPHKLHTDIWYNEKEELNDGPACSCNEKCQIGPLHNDYPGETTIPACQPNSNNYKQLYHYRLIISPPQNFLSATPTIIRHNSKSYAFAGFSLFTHQPLVDLPVCQVVRYNIVYELSLVKETFPVGFTVRSLDLMTDYLFNELLELLDVNWWPNVKDNTESDENKGCRSIHLFPRFECSVEEKERRVCSNEGVEVWMLSSDIVLQWMLDNATQTLFDIIDLPRIHAMSLSEWSEFVDQLRGTLATFPGKKPASIRIDQLDRESLDIQPQKRKQQMENVILFPVIVHMNMVPLKLGLTREPAYKRLLKNFLKLQYLILNRPEFTKEDKIELNNLARLLENFEMNGIQRREFTVEINSDGFFRTGIKTDIVQFALCVPSIMSHIRFHFSLSELESRLKFKFKDKSILHQALTHPSYQNTNYGTNPDHFQNTNITCGLRHIEYGDKISLYRSFRKKGLSKMVQIMSYMPFQHETRSSIFGNERLECLGDAVIELITSVHLFYMFPELSEGHLDSFRQALVQNHYLADLAVRLGLHKFLLYTHNTDFSFDSTITHARSDAFEAVMAAITLDGGLNEADRIFGCVLFGDDPRIHQVWCELPVHRLQEQFPNGDRHVIQNSPIFKNLTKLEDRLGIQFIHIRLLAKAMTIRKTGYNVFTLGDNQRLEFLGDSLLKYVTTDYLFKHFPRHHEGHLSLLRNTLVNRYTQARVCRELGLDEFIIRKDSIVTTNGTINGTGNKQNSFKLSQKPHADLLEAFLGALFVDKDLTWVERFCQVCFWPRLVHFILNQKWNDPKSRLQQCCLTFRSLNEDPEIAHYKLISTYGSTDNREFKVAVYFRGVRLATGFGSSIQIAEMNAANLALENYKDEFKQLSYQEKVINQQYDSGFRKKMLNQYENWDNELVERFVDKPVQQLTKNIGGSSGRSYKSKYEGANTTAATGSRFGLTKNYINSNKDKRSSYKDGDTRWLKNTNFSKGGESVVNSGELTESSTKSDPYQSSENKMRTIMMSSSLGGLLRNSRKE